MDFLLLGRRKSPKEKKVPQGEEVLRLGGKKVNSKMIFISQIQNFEFVTDGIPYLF
uniref:Uncharacterized protein n=1 Tax=Marseillevirus LCMAC101 TaxID=2506602 RepID=A0A481YUL7_9VIRU|nr:MAG: hypothetical protein LCMAC101_07910 [Marseillevirus LCMAC101]